MNDNNNNNIITVTLHIVVLWVRIGEEYGTRTWKDPYHHVWWTKITHMIHWDKENGSNITWLNKYKGIEGHEEWLVTLHNDQEEENVCRFKLFVT